MADSYLLKSQEQTTPFEMSQVESARQQGAAPVQAGLQAFQGMQENNRQNIATYLAMEESKRRNAENATMVALEEAKRQDYVAKMQAFQMELDTRSKVNAIKLQDMMLEKQRNELKLEQETNEMPEGIYGKPYQLPNGEVGRLMPTPGKKRSVWTPLGPDEKKAWHRQQEDAGSRALRDRSAAMYNMRRTGVPEEYINRVINSWDDEPSTPSDTGFGKMSQAVGDVAAGQVQAPKPSRPSDPAQVIDTLEGPEREQVTSLMNDKELGNPAKVRKYLVDMMNTARESGYSPYAALQIALRSKDLKKLIKERQ